MPTPPSLDLSGLRDQIVDAGQAELSDPNSTVDDYVNAAIDCMQGGNCSKMDLLAAGAIAAGADPQMVAATQGCLETGDDETCAKAGVTIAAIAACSAATSGSGTVACSYVAPYVIDFAWPVLKQFVVPLYDVLFVDDIVEAVRDVLNDLGITEEPSMRDNVIAPMEKAALRSFHLAQAVSRKALVDGALALMTELHKTEDRSLVWRGNRVTCHTMIDELLDENAKLVPEWSHYMERHFTTAGHDQVLWLHQGVRDLTSSEKQACLQSNKYPGQCKYAWVDGWTPARVDYHTNNEAGKPYEALAYVYSEALQTRLAGWSKVVERVATKLVAEMMQDSEVKTRVAMYGKHLTVPSVRDANDGPSWPLWIAGFALAAGSGWLAWRHYGRSGK